MNHKTLGASDPQRSPSLDRMEIEEFGKNKPEKLAEAILQQLGPVTSAIPIAGIARALDIVEIRHEPLNSLEGALITTGDRNVGSILINSSSNRQRQRFTLAHELGHFLNQWHEPPTQQGFMCSAKDLRAGYILVKPGLTRQEVQELEANRFAIELLAPRQVIAAQSSDDPSLSELLGLAQRFDLSKSAMARRYVELHPAKTAAVFSKNGQASYYVKSKACPVLAMQKGDLFLQATAAASSSIISEERDVEVRKGTGPTIDRTAWAETLFQREGYAITLLSFDSDGLAGDEEDGPQGLQF